MWRNGENSIYFMVILSAFQSEKSRCKKLDIFLAYKNPIQQFIAAI